MKNILFFLAVLLISCAPVGKTLYVASETRQCTGVGLMECMLIKWDVNQPEWELFYDSIDGFEYERGYEYELSVIQTKIENPPADGSSIKFTLSKVVSKTQKQSEF